MPEPLASRLKVKVDPLTAHDSYNAREGAHDDLVFACALAVWYAERPRPKPAEVAPSEAWHSARR